MPPPQSSARTLADRRRVLSGRTLTVCSKRASLGAAFSTSTQGMPSSVTASRKEAPGEVTHMPVSQPSGIPLETAEKSPLRTRFPASGLSAPLRPRRKSHAPASSTISASTAAITRFFIYLSPSQKTLPR